VLDVQAVAQTSDENEDDVQMGRCAAVQAHVNVKEATEGDADYAKASQEEQEESRVAEVDWPVRVQQVLTRRIYQISSACDGQRLSWTISRQCVGCRVRGSRRGPTRKLARDRTDNQNATPTRVMKCNTGTHPLTVHLSMWLVRA